MRRLPFVLFLFLGSALGALAQFTEQVIEASDLNASRSVLLADLNGDSDKDIVVCGGRSLGWYANLGGGQFASFVKIQQRTDCYDYAWSFDVADLDGDSDLDIVVSWTLNDVSWYANDGAGGFGPGQVISNQNGYIHSQVVATDMDGDGDKDIVSSAPDGTPAFAWYPNDGLGQFGQANSLLNLTLNAPFSVFAIDLDGDGDDDLGYSAQGSPRAALNDGNGSFAQSYSGSSSTWRPPGNAGDMDGDGDMDLVHGSGSWVKWVANLNGAYWGTTAYINTNSAPSHLLVADLDLNGTMDLLVAAEVTGQVFWLSNPGPGPTGPSIMLTDSCNGVSGIDVGDLDGDGDPDIVCNSSANSQAAWIENLGLGTFGPLRRLDLATSSIEAVRHADLDGDGHVDVITASALAGKLAWYANDGINAFGPQRLITTSLTTGPTDFGVADFDNDGDNDVLTCLSGSFGAQDVVLLLNDGNAEFSAPLVICDSLPDPDRLHLADLDGDGDMDVVCQALAQLSTFQNMGGASFIGGPMINTPPSNPRSSTIGDVDGDGDADLIASFIQTNSVGFAWYENDGSGSFGMEIPIASSGSGVTAIALSDLDVDGDLDLAFIELGLLKWRANDGQGNFSAALPLLTTATTAHDLRLEDMDLDGDPDLLASVNATGNKSIVNWWTNDGSGAFGTPFAITDTALCTSVHRLAIGDTDGDGDPDVSVGVNGEGLLLHYENNGLITGASPTAQGSAFTAYPVPFTDVLHLDLGRELKGGHIDLLDAQGRTVRTMRGNGAKELLIERGTLASGLYVVRVSLNGVVLTTARVIAD